MRGLLLFLRRMFVAARPQSEQARGLAKQHVQLESEVVRRTAELTELTRHLQIARDAEKALLARELHDELGGLLTAAMLDSARLKRAIGDIPSDAQARLRHLNDSINRGIAVKRRLIEQLRPSTLSNLGLGAALEILVREFAAGSPAQVTARMDAVELGESSQIAAYRLVQEGLLNSQQHASASKIMVTLEVAPNAAGVAPGQRMSHVAHVSVEDNGCGFDPDQRRGTPHGLMGLRYRVEAEGGKMALHSSPGRGTRVEAWLPLCAPVAGGAVRVAAAATDCDR